MDEIIKPLHETIYDAVHEALKATRGNKSAAARLLCINRNTLAKYAKELKGHKKKIPFQVLRRGFKNL